MLHLFFLLNIPFILIVENFIQLILIIFLISSTLPVFYPTSLSTQLISQSFYFLSYFSPLSICLSAMSLSLCLSLSWIQFVFLCVWSLCRSWTFCHSLLLWKYFCPLLYIDARTLRGGVWYRPRIWAEHSKVSHFLYWPGLYFCLN